MPSAEVPLMTPATIKENLRQRQFAGATLVNMAMTYFFGELPNAAT